MVVRSMMILHYVLIMLNLLFVTGHVDLKQRLLKNLGNEHLENIKDIINKRLMTETSNIYENGLRNGGDSDKKNKIKMVIDVIVSLMNALKSNVKVEKADKNVETKDKKKDVGKRLNDDVILIYDEKSGRLLGRSGSIGIDNFLKNVKGRFNGNITLNNNVNLDGQYGAHNDDGGYWPPMKDSCDSY